MARLPYADPAPLPDLNIFRLIAHAESVYRDFSRYGLGLLRDLQLDARDRERAILRVAALTPGAEYEWVQHEAIARAVGLSEAEIEACRAGDPEDLLLRFTEQVVRDATPDDATFTAMAERHPPREIVELILVIGQYMTLARVMATAQIDLDEPIGTALIDRGGAA